MSYARIVGCWWITVAVVVLGCHFDGSGPNANAAEGPCLGLICNCRDTETCAPLCELEGCVLACERLDTCAATCGAACAPSCEASRTCDLSCGDDCAARCESTGGCEVTCGSRCEFDCADAGTCRVSMRDGVARCTRTGTCEVECVGADGKRRPARAEPDGLWVCDPDGVVEGSN